MSVLSATWWSRRNSQRGNTQSDASKLEGEESPERFAGLALANDLPWHSSQAATDPTALQPSEIRFPYQLPSISQGVLSPQPPLQVPTPPSTQTPTQFPTQLPTPPSAQFPTQFPTHFPTLSAAASPAAFLSMDFGPIHHLMTDPTIEEIWINSPQKVFISRNGKTELTNVLLSGELVENLVERALMWGGRRLDRSHPFVDVRLPDGSRLHVAIPDVTAEHWAVNIRKHLMHGKTLMDLSQMGVFPDEVRELISTGVKARKNILVSGSTQAGKTTLLNALIAEVPQYERVITIEEVFELRSVLPDVVSMQTRSASLEGTGEITLRDLIKESLRMRPSRLVVGEIREAESLDLLIALNSGIPGMATIHGNSARDAVRKLQTLPLLAGENISFQFIAPTVARSIDWVIHVGIDPKSGVRRLREICEVTGRIEGDALEIEQLYSWSESPREIGS
jgi:pilus assembly protein CpaF